MLVKMSGVNQMTNQITVSEFLDALKDSQRVIIDNQSNEVANTSPVLKLPTKAMYMKSKINEIANINIKSVIKMHGTFGYEVIALVI